MRDVQHIYMNVPRWTGRTIEEGTPWMEAAAELESVLAQLDSLLGEFGGIGFSSQMETLNSVTDGINAMRDARKYLHEEIVRLVDRPLEECFTRAVNALAAIDFDEIRVENKAGLVVNHAEVGEQSAASRNKEYYSLSDVLKENVPELNKCVGYHQKIDGFREILEEMGGFTLSELQKKDSGTDDEKPKGEKGFWEKLGDSIDNFLMYHDYGRADNPTGNPPAKTMEEIIRGIMDDLQEREEARTLIDIINKSTTAINVKLEEAKQKEAEMKYINKYVNEETLLKINENWNIDKLKELCGDDCMEELRELMYEYRVTDETSILMFLCTSGVECNYGNNLKELYVDGYFDDKKYTLETRGAGLLQLTGKTQKEFLDYVVDKVDDEDLKEKINLFREGYYVNSQKVSVNEFVLEENGREINAADFIAENFAMESAVWFWAENTEKAKIYQGENKTNVSINTYICTVEASNKNNLFLVTQLMVNGVRGWAYSSLQEMATQKNDIETDSDNIYFESGSRTPNGWLRRRNDWDNAVKLTGEQFN